VKVTRPAVDLERESVAFRLEQLERHRPTDQQAAAPERSAPVEPAPEVRNEVEPPPVELEQLREAWSRTVLPAVEQRSIPTASVLREAHPADLAGDRLTVEFPAAAAFHRKLAEEPKNATVLEEALREVTGRRFALAFSVGEGEAEESDAEEEGPASEDEILALMRETFDARELEEP
jgi:hypothetical protein